MSDSRRNVPQLVGGRPRRRRRRRFATCPRRVADRRHRNTSRHRRRRWRRRSRRWCRAVPPICIVTGVAGRRDFAGERPVPTKRRAESRRRCRGGNRRPPPPPTRSGGAQSLPLGHASSLSIMSFGFRRMVRRRKRCRYSRPVRSAAVHCHHRVMCRGISDVTLKGPIPVIFEH